MLDKVWVYALCKRDPFTVRYVGLTRHLAARLSQHLYDCTRKSTQTYKARWLRHLLANGERPILVPLEAADKEEASRLEREWILLFKSLGNNLTNATTGGETGFAHSLASVQRCAEKSKIYWKSHLRTYSAESRYKMSEGQKRRIAEGRSNIYKLASERVGKAKSREVVEKAAAKLRGRKLNLTDEQRQKLRESTLRQWENKEFRQKMRWVGYMHMTNPVFAAKLGKRPRSRVVESR